MTQPMDPNNHSDDESEYGWGAGLFPPGVANNEGQTFAQDDFGVNMKPPVKPIGAHNDNYARAVADRRTDPTDPDSNRDFEELGNPDRFGGNPPLVKAPVQQNISQHPNIKRNKLERKP